MEGVLSPEDVYQIFAQGKLLCCGKDLKFAKDAGHDAQTRPEENRRSRFSLIQRKPKAFGRPAIYTIAPVLTPFVKNFSPAGLRGSADDNLAQRSGNHERLILFTRYPVAGKVKTRPVPALGIHGWNIFLPVPGSNAALAAMDVKSQPPNFYQLLTSP